MIGNRRLGRIKISLDLIREANYLIKKEIMSRVLVLEATTHYDISSIYYLVQCDDFEEVKEGEVCPEYNAVFITTKKVDENGEEFLETKFERWQKISPFLQALSLDTNLTKEERMLAINTWINHKLNLEKEI